LSRLLASASFHDRVKIVMSGPLVDDDGQTMIGSLFLIEAPSPGLRSKRSTVPTLRRSGHLGQDLDYRIFSSTRLSTQANSWAGW